MSEAAAPSEEKELTEEQLQQLQTKMDQARATACMQAIKEALEKYKCVLHYQEIRMSGELVKADWVVTTRPKTPQG